MLTNAFFDRQACEVAKDLLGKVIRRRYQGLWLAAQIIETEAYYIHEKASHSSLGYTKSRKAMFMPAGTIYMYYSRGGDSLNISCHGEGNAVLIKSAFPYQDHSSPPPTIHMMQRLHGPQRNGLPRPLEKLCSGQTLLCRALHLRVPDWNQHPFNAKEFFIDDVGLRPGKIIQTRRLGIPEGRDEHLMQRYIDWDLVKYCSSNPLTKRGWQEGIDYRIVQEI